MKDNAETNNLYGTRRVLYKSKLGEIKTKQEWLTWGEEFYKNIGYRELNSKLPSNIWERIKKVMGVTRHDI